MLEGLERFLAKIREWYPAEKEIQEFIEVYSPDIVNAVRVQLASGIDGNGDLVYLFRHGKRMLIYARYTIQRKDMFGSGLGSVTDRITNFMSGTFYESIFVQSYSDGSFQVLSSDPLYELIKERSGADIINLSPEAEEFIFTEKIAPKLQAGINAIFYEM